MAVFRRGVFSYLRDILSMSPTRVLAVARLTLKEAIRRKTLMVFVIFAVLLMFGGWFLSSGNSREELQTGVQIWFLLTAISWLVLPAVMFLGLLEYSRRYSGAFAAHCGDQTDSQN